MQKSDLRDYSNAYIVVKGRLTFDGTDDSNKKKNKKLTLEDNSLFRSYLTKVNITLIDNAGDLDIVMPMYDPLQYSYNYPMT